MLKHILGHRQIHTQASHSHGANATQPGTAPALGTPRWPMATDRVLRCAPPAARTGCRRLHRAGKSRRGDAAMTNAGFSRLRTAQTYAAVRCDADGTRQEETDATLSGNSLRRRRRRSHVCPARTRIEDRELTVHATQRPGNARNATLFLVFPAATRFVFAACFLLPSCSLLPSGTALRTPFHGERSVDRPPSASRLPCSPPIIRSHTPHAKHGHAPQAHGFAARTRRAAREACRAWDTSKFEACVTPSSGPDAQKRVPTPYRRSTARHHEAPHRRAPRFPASSRNRSPAWNARRRAGDHRAQDRGHGRRRASEGAAWERRRQVRRRSRGRRARRRSRASRRPTLAATAPNTTGIVQRRRTRRGDALSLR